MTKPTPLIRQKNPSGRITYYEPTRYGMRRWTRPNALAAVAAGDAYWAGEAHERIGGPGAPNVALLVDAAANGQMDLTELA